jgi:type I restriction enzyme R subunit
VRFPVVLNRAGFIHKAFQKYRKGTPFVPEEPDKDLCPKLCAKILSTDVFTQKDYSEFSLLAANGIDAQSPRPVKRRQ